MKKILQLILYCLPIFLHAQKTVNVISKNGLNLRETASETALAIEKIPFGADLTVLQNTQIACKPVLIFKKDTVNKAEYDNQVENDLALTGTFLKVMYQGKMGFVNSLYTCSTIPNLIFLNQKRMDRNEIVETEEDIYFYLLNQYFKVKKGSKKELQYSEKTDQEKNVTTFFTKKYTNGLQYTFTSYYTDIGSGGYSIAFTSKNLSFNEAMMVARLIFYQDITYKIGFVCNSEKNNCELSYYAEGSSTYAKIYKNEQGYWTLEYGSGAC